MKNERSARSLLASAARYYGGDKSWSAFFSMAFEVIKFFFTYPIVFFEVIAVGKQIFYPNFKPELLSELLATESCKKFIKNPENQKVMTDLAIGFGKIEEKDKEKFQKAASIAFDLLSEGQDTKISAIPDMLADKGLIAKDSTAMKILGVVLICSRSYSKRRFRLRIK